MIRITRGFENHFMIKRNNYIRDVDNEEIEEIKYYKSLYKFFRMNLKIYIYIFFY